MGHLQRCPGSGMNKHLDDDDEITVEFEWGFSLPETVEILIDAHMETFQEVNTAAVATEMVLALMAHGKGLPGSHLYH